MDKDVNRVLNYLTERLEIAINHSKDDEQRGYIRAKGMVNDARELGFKPDMREKVREYISELDAEIDRCRKIIEEKLSNIQDDEEKEIYCFSIEYITLKTRMITLSEVKNDLQSRLDELI